MSLENSLSRLLLWTIVNIRHRWYIAVCEQYMAMDTLGYTPSRQIIFIVYAQKPLVTL